MQTRAKKWFFADVDAVAKSNGENGLISNVGAIEGNADPRKNTV